MARFEATNISVADVPVSRDRIWAVVTSPERLAELTPLIERITADGDVWEWHLRTVSALGTSIDPTFTERMSFDDGHHVAYEHHPPPGRSERAGARGTYTLSELAGGGTHLAVDLTLHVELPLPAVARRAVEGVMGSMMARTGEKFAENLYAYLGIKGQPSTTQIRSR